ncbi:MAG: polyhydroxyalkanoate synthesis regulator DNA-binding domain-containing protein [Deltaproteobacteria bacterium]|nr:polyhydroxyalkanoate synthesis regulator DNA-binding domain-containing protein [Deltaproteobacteria bacterium]
MTTHTPKVIKRYQNRKLYDTTDSCYVTLEDIAEMIKLGEEVQIIDNASKEDITSLTFAQIILEEQRKKTNVLPLQILTDMIRTRGGALRELLAKTIESGVREIGHVREFVDEKIRPAVENVQSIPTLQSELKHLREKLETLEADLRRRGSPPPKR